MAIAFVQSASGTTGSGTSVTSGALASTTTSGNALIVVVPHTSSQKVLRVTDTGNNNYQQVVTSTIILGQVWNFDIFIAHNIGATASLTATAAQAGAGVIHIHVQEFSGLALYDAFDGWAAKALSSGTSLDSANVPLTRSTNELLIGLACANSVVTYTAGSGYTNGVTTNDATRTTFMASQVVAAKSEYKNTATISVSGNWGCAIATFSDTPLSQPSKFNNFQTITAGSGISVLEKIR